MTPLKLVLFGMVALLQNQAPARQAGIFDVRQFGATGRRSDNATNALRAAVDVCFAAGGGVVIVPPGEYTTGGRQGIKAGAAPAIVLENVAGASLRDSSADAGCGTFVSMRGNANTDIRLRDNDTRQARKAIER